MFANFVLPGDCHPKNYPGTEPEVLVWDSISFQFDQSFNHMISFMCYNKFNFRDAAAGPPSKDGTDVFSERPDPNALKVGNCFRICSV